MKMEHKTEKINTNPDEPAHPIFLPNGYETKTLIESGLTKREYLVSNSNISYGDAFESIMLNYPPNVPHLKPTMEEVLAHKVSMQIIESDEILKQLENGK